jgi:hypothetical protein
VNVRALVLVAVEVAVVVVVVAAVNKKNSVASSVQKKYTDRVIAACRRS